MEWWYVPLGLFIVWMLPVLFGWGLRIFNFLIGMCIIMPWGGWLCLYLRMRYGPDWYQKFNYQSFYPNPEDQSEPAP